MLRRIVLALVLAFALTGCAAIAKALPTIIATITEASGWLEAIDAQAEQYFADHPDPAKQKQYRKLRAKAEAALSAAMAATKGVQDLDQQDVDAAFAEFQKVYQEVLALLGPLGIVAPSPPGGTLGVSPDGGVLMVPQATALVPRVE